MRSLWEFLTGEALAVRMRTDASAAGSMAQRQDIGRVPHLRSEIKIRERVIEVLAIPTVVDGADLGT